MTDYLVQRLRWYAEDSVGNYGMPICAKAADEIERLRAENDALKTAPESALSIEQLRAERAVGFREGYEAAMKGRP